MSENRLGISKKRIVFSVVMFLVMTGVALLCMETVGRANLLPAMMMVVQSLMFMLAKIDEKPWVLFLKVLAVNMGLCLGASTVTLNIWLGIVVNFCVVFAAATLLYREKGIQVYFPFMLCYVYMMVGTPIGFDRIGSRLIVVVCGAVLVGLMQFIAMRRLGDESNGIANFMKGFVIDVSSVRFSYAFRLALGVTLMWFIVRFFDIEYGKWLVISVNSIVMPDVPKAAVKLRRRILGCIVGVIIFFVLFSLIDVLWARLFIVGLAAFCSIFFMKKYAVKCACYSVMSLAAISFGDPVGLGFVIDRPIFVVIGGCVAMIINLCLFRRDESEADPL